MLFRSWKLGNRVIPNRLVRAATYEGMADREGNPQPALGRLYARLAASGIGTIITGFCFVNKAGKAMQPRQSGIETDARIAPWGTVVRKARLANEKTALFMQLSHAGRQTIASPGCAPLLAPGTRGSAFFRSSPVAMSSEQIQSTIADFIAAARRAKKAGFDGVELHGAHGYLIHQFLSPTLNDRDDSWGVDRLSFLRAIIRGIQAKNGIGFPILVKLSAGDDMVDGVTEKLAAAYVKALAALGVAAVEISYGTMDLAFNIFRGGAPVKLAMKHNPLFASRMGWQKYLWRLFYYPGIRRRLKPFSDLYNLPAARSIRAVSEIPIILVGGVRDRTSIERVLKAGGVDAVATVTFPNISVR